MSLASFRLSTTQRETLTLLADLIVPRYGPMPSASEVNVPGEGIDSVLALRPDLVAPLVRLIAACPDPLDEPALHVLAATDPGRMHMAIQAIAGAYYMHPRVRELIGYGVPDPR